MPPWESNAGRTWALRWCWSSGMLTITKSSVVRKAYSDTTYVL